MYRVAVIALLLVLAGLQYRLWVGDGSLAQVHHLQTMRDHLQHANVQARKRNNAMQVQVRDLKSGDGAAEAQARSEMGMVKPGETFFLTVPDENSSPKTPKAGRRDNSPG